MDDMNQPMMADTEDTGETVEQFGEQVARSAGYDPQDPAIKGQIDQVVRLARSQMPGSSDSQIITEVKKNLPQVMEKIAPQFAKLPNFDANKYASMQQQYNAEFGGDAAVKKREELRTANIGAEAGRALNIGARLGAGREYQGMLDDQYNSVKTANQQEIIGDWTARRDAKVAEMEQMVKNGEINDKQVKREMDDFALKQLREETATKDAARTADNDPNSLVSQGARVVIERGMPDVVKKMGDRWSTMSKAQIVALLPYAEARIKAQEAEGLKQLEANEKQKDRDARLAEAKVRAGAVTDAAGIRAAAKAGSAVDQDPNLDREGFGPGGTTSLVRVDRNKNRFIPKEDVESFKALEKNANSAESLLETTQGFEQAVNLAPSSGIGNLTSDFARYIGIKGDATKAREEIERMTNQAVAMIAAIDPRAKGAPSNADVQGMKDTFTNPNTSPEQKFQAIRTVRGWADTMVREHKNAFETLSPETITRLKAYGVGSKPGTIPTTDTDANATETAGGDAARNRLVQDLAALDREISRAKPGTEQYDILVRERQNTNAKLKQGSTETVPPTNAKGWKLMTDANGNRAYVSPDRKQFEEVK